MLLSNGKRLLSWPLDAHVITAGWYYSNGSYHGAIDLRCTSADGSTAMPVYAAEDGKVDWVQRWDGKTIKGDQSYGNLVRVRHADYKGKALHTYYAHLSSIQVAHGQQVTEGQLLGYTGATGNCQGAHLHYEVRLASKRCNPLNWLDGDFERASSKVKLGRYTSVARPTLGSLLVSQASPGDLAQIRALADSLGLTCTAVE